MALDYLSVPGLNFYLLYKQQTDFECLATSTAVERVFSQGRQLLHFTRNALSARSIQAFLCLGSWCRNDLIVTEDLIPALGSLKRKAALDFDL
jgi:hypothetical protein